MGFFYARNQEVVFLKISLKAQCLISPPSTTTHHPPHPYLRPPTSNIQEAPHHDQYLLTPERGVNPHPDP